MNKFFASLFLFSAISFGQDFTGYKFYLNPGHGGNDPANDRFIPETGFWESESNLTKGLYFRDLLVKHNATVIMSRTTNYESDDRALSSIAAEANANNVDFFHSIHSNATGTTSKANYTLMLFRGYDNQPVFPAAKTMSQIMYHEITAANRTEPFTNGVRGDWSFYPQWGDKVGLGVLRPLIMPGVLSEGSFHDYLPESFRLTNLDYRRHEAVSFLRAFIKFFNKSSLPYGTVAGIVRDLTRDVSYTWLATLPNDKKAPINGITVRLEPVGRIYHGDQKNNGFFFFDSVGVGTYQLYVSAEGYSVDSAQIDVIGDQPHFKDFFLTSNRPPVVLSYSPMSSMDSVRINTPIVIHFNTVMNRAKTEAAFQLTPTTAGSFSWQNYDQTLTFTAENHFQPKTTYTVTLDTTAVNRFGVPISEPLQFSFTTDHIGRFAIESSYPNEKNNQEISTTVQVIIVFNYPLSYASLSGNLSVEDAAGVKSPLIRAKATVENGKGVLRFEFKNPLKNDQTYFIRLGAAVRSTYGINLFNPVTIPFHTEKETPLLSERIDAFDTVTSWQEPQNSPRSQGIDTVLTRLTTTSDRFVSASSAAKLTYVFNDQSGVVDLSLRQPFSLAHLSPKTKLGTWVFGDRSENVLEFIFLTASDSFMHVIVDTIDWTGWKSKSIDMDSVNVAAAWFSGFMLRQIEEAAPRGELYFDELSMGLATAVDVQAPSFPDKAILFPNHPNPFNPSTTIEYAIAEGVHSVELTIFNLLGNRVRKLVDKMQTPGIYTAVWDGCDDQGVKVGSGIYLCRLKVGDSSWTRSMVLLK